MSRSFIDRHRISLSTRVLLLSVIIGIVSGIGSIVFYLSLQVCTQLLLGLTGYCISPPAGEKELIKLGIHAIQHRYLIILIPLFGGIISGLLVYFFAPEAEGDGTDAVIGSYHYKRGKIRGRVPIIKTIASAVLIGSGGSAGREGPISQIGAGFASGMSSKLGLSDREREVLVVSGMAAGIGSIFRAPLGGSLFGIEVLYKRDYEVEALVPNVIATFVAYIVFSLVVGWDPIFSVPQYSFSPMQLPFFAILGFVAGILVRIYVKVFYWTRDSFDKVNMPRYLKPALGGLLVGLLGYFIPQILGTGYGWIQYAINNWDKMALWLFLILIFGKMIATSLSVGSGGSGGVFAPSVVIGGFLGGCIGLLFYWICPQYSGDPGVFILIGMGCFFAAAAKVPIASIVMVAEMTWDYNILAPAFLASIVAYLVSGDESIYEKQIDVRIHSPLHEREFVAEFLGTLVVKSIALPDIRVVYEDMSLADLERVFSDSQRLALPVVDREENYLGIVTIGQLIYIPLEKRSRMKVRDIVQCKFVYVHPEDSVLVALYKMLKHEIPELPVVDRKTGKLIGEISFRDIIKILHFKAEEYFEELKAKYKVG